ncbi:MAG: hypothetical protein R3F65_32480 [bacterium]
MLRRGRAGMLLTCWALLFAGCTDGSDDDPSDRGPAPDEGRPPVVVDAAPSDADPDAERDATPDPEPDLGPDAARADAEPTDAAPPPDMSGPRDYETCEQVCGRYAECERLGERFGDYDGCLDDCARLSRGGRPDDWFDCVEFEQCNLLGRCPVPEIEPLTCDEVCALVGECGVDVPVPDCAATCAETGAPFQRCGEALYGGRCDSAAFSECVIDEVFPECRALCDAGAACNLVRPAECLADCLADTLSGDPLGALRARQLAQCTTLAAADCERLDACFFPPVDGGGGVNPAAFCADYGACGLGEFYTCDEMVAELGPDGLECAQDLLDQSCPAFDPFLEFDLIDFCAFGGGVDPRLAPCQRLCEAREVCGLLPEGEQRFACVNGCVGVGGADPDAQERADSALDCGGADRCPDLVACIEASGPAADCAALCGSLAGCGLADADCEAACDAQWPRDRHAAYRECVAAAADCAAIAACPLDPGPPCDAFCARRDECGLAAAGCVGRCDDAHYADPAGQNAEVACALTAPVCARLQGPHNVQGCGPQSLEGSRCLGYCRATTECAGDAAGLAPCLEACGEGLGGDDGLRFLGAADCLDARPLDAACDALVACVPDIDADCDALCDRAAACGVTLTECPARCADDPLARLRALRAEVCLAPAADCDAVRGCLVPAPFDPTVVPVEPELDQGRWCAAFDGCPDAGIFFGECRFEFEFIGDELGEAGLACTYAALDDCGPLWLDMYDACFDGGGGGPVGPSPVEAPCAVLCEAERICEPEGPAQRVCVDGCVADLDRDDPDGVFRLAPRLDCGGAWSCGDLDACLAASDPAAICAAQCEARAACGQVPDADDCARACDRDFGRARELARRTCLADVAPDDCAAIAACEPPAPLPCDLACAALAGCGIEPERCVQSCDDAGFADPAGQAQRIACLVAADGDCAAVAACERDPGNGGGACFAYCRATTECAAEPAEDLPACLTRCLTGFGDDDALRFAAAERCLDGAAGAECPALLACLPAEAAVDCEAYCGALDDCRIPAADCRAACAAAPDAAAAICVSDARRTGGRCAGVAACVGHVPPPASADCRALCDQVAACDRDVDPWLCRLDCTPDPVALPFQRACAAQSSCGPSLETCLALDGAVAPGCDAVCTPAVIDGCGLYDDLAACEADCTGRDAGARTPDGWVDRVADCLDGVVAGGACDPDAAAACLQPASCDLRDDLIYFDGVAGAVDVDLEGLEDVYETASCGSSFGPEAIIVLTVVEPSTLTAQISAANFDTMLFIRADCDGEDIECNDDSFDIDLPDGLWSSFIIDVEPGNYYLFVEGYFGEVGQATVRIDIEPN